MASMALASSVTLRADSRARFEHVVAEHLGRLGLPQALAGAPLRRPVGAVLALQGVGHRHRQDAAHLVVDELSHQGTRRATAPGRRAASCLRIQSDSLVSSAIARRPLSTLSARDAPPAEQRHQAVAERTPVVRSHSWSPTESTTVDAVDHRRGAQGRQGVADQGWPSRKGIAWVARFSSGCRYRRRNNRKSSGWSGFAWRNST